MKRILPSFSYIFHPIFIPVIALAYFFVLDDTFLVPAEKYLITIQVVIITILIPGSFYFLLRSLGKIDSVMAQDVSQRKLPLLVQIILTYVLIRQDIIFDPVPKLYYFFLSAMLSMLAAFVLVLFKVKASLHLMGMAGFVFFLIGLGIHNEINVNNTLAFWLVMTGLVATSRLHMKAHTIIQLVLGFFLGVIPQMAMWHFWL